MTSKSAPELPPAEEWDFRQVEPLALHDATVWEYARSCDSIREAILEFLDFKVHESVSVRQLLNDHRTMSSAEKKRLAGLGIWRDIQVEGKRLRLGFEVPMILTWVRTDFPQPWLFSPPKFKVNPDFKDSRFHCNPLSETIARLNVNPVLDEVFAGDGSYHLTIGWEGSTKGEILENFRRWLDSEAKLHTHMLRRGKPAQEQTHFLKALAARRLRDAGFTYEQARVAIKGCNDGGRLIPYYARPDGWSDAIKRANELIEFFARVRDFPFGF